jgi:hypothetical protein
MEEEFLRRWREGADELARQLPGATIRLFRDTRDPLRFQSIGGPVASEATLDAIRESEGFRASMDSIAETLESVEVSALEVLVELGS